MKITFKHIAIRIITLLLLLIIINEIYNHFFYEKDLAVHSDLIELINKIPKETDILYVAESSNTAFHKNDIERKTIAEYLDGMVPNKIVADLTKPAAHAGIYKKLLAAIPVSSNIKTVVVTLNLRSFNAQWIHSKLETSLQKSTLFLRPNPPLLNRFLLSFKDYEIKSEQMQEAAFKNKWEADKLNMPYPFEHKNVIEWDNWMAWEGIKNEDGSRNQEKTELACHYIKGYGFQIDTIKNPRIHDFNDIIQLSKERNWNIIFNLLAENVETAEALVGRDLLF